MVKNTRIPAILIYKGGLNDKIKSVVKTSNINNNKWSFNEQKKNDVKATAAILRVSK